MLTSHKPRSPIQNMCRSLWIAHKLKPMLLSVSPACTWFLVRLHPRSHREPCSGGMENPGEHSISVRPPSRCFLLRTTCLMCLSRSLMPSSRKERSPLPLLHETTKFAVLKNTSGSPKRAPSTWKSRRNATSCWEEPCPKEMERRWHRGPCNDGRHSFVPPKWFRGMDLPDSFLAGGTAAIVSPASVKAPSNCLRNTSLNTTRPCSSGPNMPCTSCWNGKPGRTIFPFPATEPSALASKSAHVINKP